MKGDYCFHFEQPVDVMLLTTMAGCRWEADLWGKEQILFCTCSVWVPEGPLWTSSGQLAWCGPFVLTAILWQIVTEPAYTTLCVSVVYECCFKLERVPWTGAEPYFPFPSRGCAAEQYTSKLFYFSCSEEYILHHAWNTSKTYLHIFFNKS